MGSLLNIYVYICIYENIYTHIFSGTRQTRTYFLSDLVPYKEMSIIGLLPVGKRGLIFSLALGFLSVSVHESLLLTRTLMTSR